MDGMIERDILPILEEHINDDKIIAIRGARQTGKSTILGLLIEKLKSTGVDEKDITFITFEDPTILDDFKNDPKGMVESYLNNNSRHYFLIDEVQYDKQAGKRIKLIFDTIKNIKLIITGSSTLDISQISKFLVGRVYIYDLYGLSFGEYLRYKNSRLFGIYSKNNELFRLLLSGKKPAQKFNEIAIADINKELGDYVVYGSYPEVAKQNIDEKKMEIIKNIYITYIGKDVTSLLGIADSTAFRKVLSLLSMQVGSLVNYNELATESQIYYKQLIGYISALEETYIVNLLRPFHRNLRTELRKNPKVYLLDTGLRNYLSNNFNGLSKRDDTGHIIENFVFNELHREVQPNQQLNFWRTLAKAEVDFIFVSGETIVPIEVKFSNFSKPDVGRGMQSFIEKYSPKSAVVATKDFVGSTQVAKTDVYFIPVAFI